MKITALRSACILTIWLAVLSGQAFAQTDHPDDDPGHLFRRCRGELQHILVNCIEQHQAILHDCVPVIRELLHLGRIEQAEAVAEYCIFAINDTTRQCLWAINRLCRFCVGRLDELGAHELADRFEWLCHRARRLVRASGEHAVDVIQGLFDDRP